MDDIKDFMRRKFILTMENYSIFNLDEYNENKVTRESRLQWHPLNSVLRQESINLIHVSKIDM